MCDPRPFQAAVRQLEAELQQARANATRSENEAQRGERLRQSNAISAELADSRSTASQAARAAVAAIQAQLDLAKLNLSFTRVTSPITGRVSRADITAGNIVTADVTPLTSVVSTDKVYAYFDANQPATGQPRTSDLDKNDSGLPNAINVRSVAPAVVRHCANDASTVARRSVSRVWVNRLPLSKACSRNMRWHQLWMVEIGRASCRERV